MIKEFLNDMSEKIPIKWDRFIIAPAMITVYGWLPRSDGQRDFILTAFRNNENMDFIYYATSSIKYSQDIQDYLEIKPEQHNNCELYENLNL